MTNEVTIHVKAKDTASKVLDTIGRTIVRQFTEASTAVLKWGSIVATAVPVVTKALVPVVTWTAKLATAAVQVAPALGFFAVSGLFLKGVLAQIFNEENKLLKVLGPIGKEFTKAGQAASKAAAEGLKPLVKDFNDLAMPHIRAAMVEIGTAINGIAKFTLGWLKTSEGLQSLTNTLGSISVLVTNLGPHFSRLAVSFLAMVGRIAEVSAAAGEAGLTGVMKRLSDAMDGVTASTVSKGLEDLKTKLNEIRTFIIKTVDIVKQVVDWFIKWKDEINLVIDAISVLTIALFPVLGPLAAIVAAVSLVVRHWDDLKGAWDKLQKKLQGASTIKDLWNQLKASAAELWPAIKDAWTQIRNAVGPVLKEIWTKIKKDLIPAFTEFVKAVTPIVKIFIEKVAPIIAWVMKQVAKDVSRGIDRAVMALRFMSGVLRVAMRVYEVLRDTVQSVLSSIKRLWNNAIDFIRDIPGRIKRIFSGARDWLMTAGRNVIRGLGDGLRTAFDAVKRWVAGIAKWIKDHKGPVSLDRQLLRPAGTALMEGLLSGLKFGFKGVGDFVYKAGSKVSDIIGKIKDSMFGGFGNLATGGYRTLGRLMAAAYGWTGANWDALNALWTRESGWNPHARNPSSGAFGIPQSLPASKMGAAAVGGNAAAQIAWGLGYIRDRYGSPLAAWGHSQATGWYDRGGMLPSGGMALNASGHPERILTPAQTRSFDRLVSVMERGGRGGGVINNTYIINATHYSDAQALKSALVNLNRQGALEVIKR